MWCVWHVYMCLVQHTKGPAIHKENHIGDSTRKAHLLSWGPKSPQLFSEGNIQGHHCGQKPQGSCSLKLRGKQPPGRGWSHGWRWVGGPQKAVCGGSHRRPRGRRLSGRGASPRGPTGHPDPEAPLRGFLALAPSRAWFQLGLLNRLWVPSSS